VGHVVGSRRVLLLTRVLSLWPHRQVPNQGTDAGGSGSRSYRGFEPE
jgi:hypothetical protein